MGSGFSGTMMTGSQHNDEFYIDGTGKGHHQNLD